MNQQDKDRLRELAEAAKTENTHAAWNAMDLYITPRLILSLLAENEELAKKAARYDWLRDNPNYQWAVEDIEGLLVNSAEKMDDAIDAAMAKQGEK